MSSLSDTENDQDEITASNSFKPSLEASIMVFVGQPRSGKSTLIKSIMNYYKTQKYFDFGIAISGSAWNGDYDYLPSKALWDGWNEDRFKEYIEVLKARAYELKKQRKKLPPSFIILDDLLGQLSSSEYFKGILSTFRHFNLTVIFAIQYPSGKSCSTLFRSIVDVAFLFPTMMLTSVIAMKESWGGYYKTVPEFQLCLNEVKRTKYACLLFRNCMNSKETAYKIFKCTPAPKSFKMVFGNKKKKESLYNIGDKSSEQPDIPPPDDYDNKRESNEKLKEEPIDIYSDSE